MQITEFGKSLVKSEQFAMNLETMSIQSEMTGASKRAISERLAVYTAMCLCANSNYSVHVDDDEQLAKFVEINCELIRSAVEPALNLIARRPDLQQKATPYGEKYLTMMPDGRGLQMNAESIQTEAGVLFTEGWIPVDLFTTVANLCKRGWEWKNPECQNAFVAMKPAVSAAHKANIQSTKALAKKLKRSPTPAEIDTTDIPRDAEFGTVTAEC